MRITIDITDGTVTPTAVKTVLDSLDEAYSESCERMESVQPIDAARRTPQGWCIAKPKKTRAGWLFRVHTEPTENEQ